MSARIVAAILMTLTLAPFVSAEPVAETIDDRNRLIRQRLLEGSGHWHGAKLWDDGYDLSYAVTFYVNRHYCAAMMNTHGVADQWTGKWDYDNYTLTIYQTITGATYTEKVVAGMRWFDDGFLLCSVDGEVCFMAFDRIGHDGEADETRTDDCIDVANGVIREN